MQVLGSRLLEWLTRIPRLLIAFVLAQLSLIAGLMVYARLRKRSPERPYADLYLPPLAVGDHQLQVFDDGASAFRDMLQSIEIAKHTIYLETYIFERDDVGYAFKQALRRKARQGVRVKVVFDGIGTFHVPVRFKRWGRQPNLRVFEFGRLQTLLSFFDVRMLVRDHRKILVVDGTIAYLGGMNIGREYAHSWRDTHLKIVGPMARHVEHTFIDFWNDHFKRYRIERSYARVSDQMIGICGNDAFRGDFPIRRTYLDAINSATRNIYISNAYLLPDNELAMALCAAAGRGVDVQIMVPFISDNILVDWMVRGRLSYFLESGVRILLYEDTMLHSKTMTVDGRWSTVGSANLDNISMGRNYEIIATIIDEAFAHQMQAMFLNDRTRCREITAQEWRQRNPLQRLGEWALQPLRPLF